MRTRSTRSALSRRRRTAGPGADARSIHCRSSTTTMTASPSCRQESRASSSTPTVSGSASRADPGRATPDRPAPGRNRGRRGRQLLHHAVGQERLSLLAAGGNDRQTQLAVEELRNKRRFAVPASPWISTTCGSPARAAPSAARSAASSTKRPTNTRAGRPERPVTVHMGPHPGESQASATTRRHSLHDDHYAGLLRTGTRLRLT